MKYLVNNSMDPPRPRRWHSAWIILAPCSTDEPQYRQPVCGCHKIRICCMRESSGARDGFFNKIQAMKRITPALLFGSERVCCMRSLRQPSCPVHVRLHPSHVKSMGTFQQFLFFPLSIKLPSLAFAVSTIVYSLPPLGICCVHNLAEFCDVWLPWAAIYY